MVFSIIMLVCLIVCVGIDYLSLKRIERNGALLGVTCLLYTSDAADD